MKNNPGGKELKWFFPYYSPAADVEPQVKMKKKIQRTILNIFLPIIFSICFGAQKNRLNETVLLSTHNICFGWEIRKLFFCYTLLRFVTKVLWNC